MRNQLITATALFIGVAAVGPIALGADDAEQLRGIVERHAGSICTVKAVLKAEIMGQSQESTAELQGAVVDAGGLVMISNMPISDRSFGSGLGGVQLSITPTDFKVTFENEDKEYAAFLATQDTELGLAFLQIENLEGRALRPIALASDAKASIGDGLVSVTRLGKGYDFAPYFQTARVSGTIRKPHQAYTVDGTLGALGLPVFSSAGETLGVLTVIAAANTQEESGGMFDPAAIMKALSGGLPFLLPARIVQGKVTQAKEIAEQMAKDREAERAKKAAEGGSGAEPAKGAQEDGGAGGDTKEGGKDK